jgi:hypothetical protein
LDETVLASFFDEMRKIAMSSTVNTIKTTKPAPISTGSKVTVTMKPGKQTTNYSNVNTETPEAAYGLATGSKSVPPPPVRT